MRFTHEEQFKNGHVMRHTFAVEGGEFTWWSESIENGESLIGHPSWCMTGTLGGRIDDFNGGMWTDEEALHACAWAVKTIRERQAASERDQLRLPGCGGAR